MTDSISRQAAIDALDEQIRRCDKALSAFDISMKDEYAVKVERASLVAFRETLEYMPSAQPEWIPVTERLPKPNEEDGNGFYKAYLVQDGRWMDVARWDGKYWVAWGYSTVLLNVVAWCELPEPYREGEQA